MAGARPAPRPEDWQISLGDLLHRAALNWGDREALVIGADRLTFARLDQAARDLALALRGRGVEKGVPVALMGHNSAAWVIAYFAIAMAGGVMVPVNPRFSPREIRYVIGKSRSDLLIAEPGQAALLRADPGPDDVVPALRLGVVEIEPGSRPFAALATGVGGSALPPVDPEATAVIMFTSGSTAFPKGCMLAHYGLVRNAVLHDARLHLGPEDRWFGPTPFFHASGCVWGILSVTAVGAALVSCDRFEAHDAMALIARERCTYQHGIETMFVRQLDVARRRRYDLSSLKKGTSTGPLDLIRRIRAELGIEYIMSKWGATEGYGNLSLCDLDDPLDRRLGSHGRIYEQFAYRIADPVRGRDPLPPGEEGEIQVRGCAMQGYYDDPAASRAVISADGWLRTGDLGRLDGPYLYYTGRIKDMLKVGGENVAAAEIEATLTRHPAVLNAAVVGRPDHEWGEIPVAFVELAHGMEATEAELIAHCRRLLAGIKTPRRVTILARLPQTGSGKVDKTKLAMKGI